MLYVDLALAAAALWAGWLMLRCPLGFHGDTMSEQVFDENGKRTPYVLQWRCRRCSQVLPAASQTSLAPRADLMLALYRDRKTAKAGRLLQMRKRA